MLKNKSVSLIGFGKSNQALYSYLKKKGIDPIIRVPTECNLPQNAKAVVGGDYLDAQEDFVFRSPVVRPDKINTNGRIYTEIGYFLENTSAIKIGITGSDGKTTTSSLIYEMLRAQGLNAHLGGNIGTPLIDKLDTLRESDLCVVELSSFQLFDIKPRLDIGIITNISQNHLDWHLDMNEYVSAKKNILTNAEQVVLPYGLFPKKHLKDKKTTYFSLDNLEPYMEKGASYVYLKDDYIYRNGKPLMRASELSLRGRFNLLNFLCATSACFDYVSVDTLQLVAREFKGVECRMQTVCTRDGITFIDSSIDSTPTRTLATLSALEAGRVVIILGGYDKGLDYSVLKDALLKTRAVVLCGENKEKILPHIREHKRIIITSTLKEATQSAIYCATDGDCVVLSPASASFDMFENYKARSRAYRQAINEILDKK